jgi:hypothetical protein
LVAKSLWGINPSLYRPKVISALPLLFAIEVLRIAPVVGVVVACNKKQNIHSSLPAGRRGPQDFIAALCAIARCGMAITRNV